MLFTVESIKNQELKSIQNFFEEFENGTQNVQQEEVVEANKVSKYLTSLVSTCYQKSVEDIENTKVGSKIVRRRNLQQIMQESFFHGANRFGQNFIA